MQQLLKVYTLSICYEYEQGGPLIVCFHPMANNVQMNWNDVQIVIGPSWDPSQRLHNKDKTCFSHWVQFMQIHTNRLIKVHSLIEILSYAMNHFATYVQ
jgi:hypothetical protein